MSVLCVIPARGGSKGIPRKNLLPVGGKPLIAWTIAQALATTEESDLIVAVSTEDEEIGRVAREHGARVIERPMELAQDTTATEPVLLHAMDVAEATPGPAPRRSRRGPAPVRGASSRRRRPGCRWSATSPGGPWRSPGAPWPA